MKRFAVRSLAFALALAAGTAAAQEYYDDRGPVYDDRYAGQDDGYYGDDTGYYGQDDAYATQDGSGYYGPSPSAYPDPRVSLNQGYGYGAQQAPAYDMARVVSVDPIVEPGQPVARQQCWSEPSPSYASQGRGYSNAYRDPYAPRAQTTGGGALLGAIAGGVLGNSVGDGDGRKAATVIGAVLGGSIGNNIERNGRYRNDPYRNQAASYPQQVQRCRTVTSQVRDERVVGYRGGYEYAGRRDVPMTD
ncbi:glycine zipper 2TM domain-containing protein [Arenimonas sp.]|uniref:glycine zipper 2TM domain-containing protein n=1 Tax=Arenimonas sp. TaxID=1872635 RepID=UPI0025BE6FDC|nr:glycine zipper 2TM domain-containing protein [Arenimonas sp.]